MADLLNPDPRIHDQAIGSLAKPLQILNRGYIFELGCLLASIFDPYGLNDDLCKKGEIPADVAFNRLAGAARCLDNWPQGFRGQIQALADRTGPESVINSLNILKDRIRRAYISTEIRDFLEEQIPELMSFERELTKALPFFPNLLLHQQALQYLRISSDKMAKLRREGLLVPATSQRTGWRNKVAYDRRILAILKRDLDDRLEIRNASVKLGVPHSAIEQMICLGLVEDFNESALSRAYPFRSIRRRSLDHLISRIHANAGEMPPNSCSLHDALSSIGGRDKPLGPILAAMADGTLPFSILPRQGSLIQKIHLEPSQARRINEFTFNEAYYPHAAFSPTMNRTDGAMLMNVSIRYLILALQRGFTECKAGETDLNRLEMLGLSRIFISHSEIAWRWNKGSSKYRKSFGDDPDFAIKSEFGRDRTAVEGYYGQQTG